MTRTSLWALILLSVPAAVCAGPTSRPSRPTLKSATQMSEPATRPAIDLADLQRELDARLRHVVRARFDAADRFDATPAGKAAKAEVAAKHKALEEARALGSSQDRLEASSAYNRALAAADRAKAQLDRGKTAMGISDVAKAVPAPAPSAPAIRPEYRVESAKSFGGMRTINVTFTIVSDAQQVESVLRSELLSSVDKDPPGGDIVIHALDDNGNNLTTPDGSSGMVFIESEGQIVTLKNYAAHKRR